MTLRDVALMALSALIAVVVSTMAAQSSGKNVVRVNELILENDKGEVVGILSTFNNGSPYLHLSNGQSTASIYLEGTSAKVVHAQQGIDVRSRHRQRYTLRQGQGERRGHSRDFIHFSLSGCS